MDPLGLFAIRCRTHINPRVLESWVLRVRVEGASGVSGGLGFRV